MTADRARGALAVLQDADGKFICKVPCGYIVEQTASAHKPRRIQAQRRRRAMLPHLKPAREFVGKYHRHNIPPVGGKFAISCFEGERLCGVAICGRPTARKLDDGATLEIYRNCTDGTRNACTKLYGACVRIARDMGYKKVITYTLESENGASLRAANFTFAGSAGGIAWTGTRRRDYYVSPEEMKNRWEYVL